MDKIAYLQEHFCYEFQMLLWWLNYKPIYKRPDVNIQLEIFLTHARVLYDFFYVPEKNYEKNLKVTDFIEKIEGRPIWEKEDSEIWDFRHKSSSTLSHIWKDRNSTKYSIQDLPIIFNKINKTIKRFINNLRDKKYDSFKKSFSNVEKDTPIIQIEIEIDETYDNKHRYILDYYIKQAKQNGINTTNQENKIKELEEKLK